MQPAEPTRSTSTCVRDWPELCAVVVVVGGGCVGDGRLARQVVIVDMKGFNTDHLGEKFRTPMKETMGVRRSCHPVPPPTPPPPLPPPPPSTT